MLMTSLSSPAILITIALTVGCSPRDKANGTVARDSAAAPSSSGDSAGSRRAGTAADTIVRGNLTSVSDSSLTLSTPGGSVRVAVAPPIKVYVRQPGDLSRVTDHSFVGVTSVSAPDGTQRATEIHVFPEELRGLGEGSRPMTPQSGGGRSTMTNGSVANSRMTNGAARMTNGTSRGAAGGTMTVEYNGGSQTISVPAGVSVTVIAPTSTKLTPGTSVIIPASKQPDGSLKASLVMLTASAQPAK
jgi:hypothetical protein